MRTLYTVATPKPIPCLDNIQGPLTTPTHFEFNDVLFMVSKGYEIYQHNPAKLSEKVRVTKRNIRNITFKSSMASAIKERSLNREIMELSKNETPKAEKKITKDEKNNTEVISVDLNKNKAIDEKKAEPIVKPDEFSKS